MDRSLGMKAFWVILAMTSLGWGLVAAGDMPTPTNERAITVNEPDQPPIRCRLLKMWTEPDGSRAYFVQSIANGDLITVVELEHGRGTAAGAISMRIYHWLGTNAPTGTPLPPANAQVFGRMGKVPQAPVTVITQAPIATPPPPKRAEAMPVQTPARPVPAQRVWPSAHVTRPATPAETTTATVSRPTVLETSPAPTMSRSVSPYAPTIERPAPLIAAAETPTPPAKPGTYSTTVIAPRDTVQSRTRPPLPVATTSTPAGASRRLPVGSPNVARIVPAVPSVPPMERVASDPAVPTPKTSTHQNVAAPSTPVVAQQNMITKQNAITQPQTRSATLPTAPVIIAQEKVMAIPQSQNMALPTTPVVVPQVRTFALPPAQGAALPATPVFVTPGKTIAAPPTSTAALAVPPVVFAPEKTIAATPAPTTALPPAPAVVVPEKALGLPSIQSTAPPATPAHVTPETISRPMPLPVAMPTTGASSVPGVDQVPTPVTSPPVTTGYPQIKEVPLPVGSSLTPSVQPTPVESTGAPVPKSAAPLTWSPAVSPPTSNEHCVECKTYMTQPVITRKPEPLFNWLGGKFKQLGSGKKEETTIVHGTTITVPEIPASSATMLSQIEEKGSQNSSAKPSVPTGPPKVEEKKPVVKTATEPAQSSDWRKSWGKVEPAKAKEVPLKDPIVLQPPSRPKPAVQTAPKADPLSSPDFFTRKPITLESTSKPVNDRKIEPAPATNNTLIPAMDPPATRPATPTILPPVPGSFGSPSNPALRPPTVPQPATPAVALPPSPRDMPRPGGPFVSVPAKEANAFSEPGQIPDPTNAFLDGPPPAPRSLLGMFRRNDAPQSPARQDAAVTAAAYVPPAAGPLPSQPAAGFALDRRPVSLPGAMPIVPVGMPAASTLPELVFTLKGAQFPSHREWAADQLGTYAAGQPEVQQALLLAVREDPAPAVRMACLRLIGRIQPMKSDAMNVVQAACQDQDARVRAAAAEMLVVLYGKPTPTPASPAEIVPVSNKVPSK